jgi:hypothetical protein
VENPEIWEISGFCPPLTPAVEGIWAKLFPLVSTYLPMNPKIWGILGFFGPFWSILSGKFIFCEK